MVQEQIKEKPLCLKQSELEPFSKHASVWLREGVCDVHIWEHKGKIYLRIETCGRKPLEPGKVYEYELEPCY